MSDTTQDSIDRLRAAISINQHLLLALYDAIDDKQTVIAQFSDVTQKTSIHTLYSELSEAFYEEFEHRREVVLQMLADTN